MKIEIPYTKLIKLALITTPLFGVLGAAPALSMNKAEFSLISSGFMRFAFVTLILWTVTIVLLRLTPTTIVKKAKWLHYAINILVCVGLMLFVWPYLIPERRPPVMIPEFAAKMPSFNFPRVRFMMPLLQVLSINVIIIVLTELVLLKERKQKIETENAQLRLANLEAKHSQLKQQIHPHFLFNSLHTLKLLVGKNPGQAEEYLVRLSELLRFSVYFNNQALVSLTKELEMCGNYLTMQKVRFDTALNFIIDVPESMEHKGYVPVHSLLQLVENAIKHNIATVKKPLYITIKGHEDSSSISVINNLQLKTTIDSVSGVGLANLAERYRLLSNNSIEIKKVNNEFVVTLNVLENESSNN